MRLVKRTVIHILTKHNPHMDYFLRKNTQMNKKTTLSKILSTNLHVLMQKEGLDTLAKLAQKAGIGSGTIHRVKNGEGSTTIATVESIAEAFNIAATELLSVDMVVKGSSLSPATQDFIGLMESTDVRGQSKILNAAQDAYELHQAHTQTVSPRKVNLGAFGQSFDKLFSAEAISNEEQLIQPTIRTVRAPRQKKEG